MDGMLMAAGAFTGLLVGLTGVGGGALMTVLPRKYKPLRFEPQNSLLLRIQ